MNVLTRKSVRAEASTSLIVKPEAVDAGELLTTGGENLSSPRKVVRGSKARRKLARRESKQQGVGTSRLIIRLNSKPTGEAEDPTEDDSSEDHSSGTTADTAAEQPIHFEMEDRNTVHNQERKHSNKRQFSFKRIPSTSEIYRSFRRKLLPRGGSKKKKCVRFADEVNESTAGDGTAKRPLCSYFEDVQPFPPFEGSPNVNPTWFGKTEYKLFRLEARRDIARDGGDSLCKKQYKALYALCRSAEGAPQVLLRHTAALCSSRHRGLEKLLFPRNVPRCRAVRAVLERQAEIRAAEMKKIDSSDNNTKKSVMDDAAAGAERVAQALAVHSRARSLAARRMARVLAEGDAYVAQDHLAEAVWVPEPNLMEI